MPGSAATTGRSLDKTKDHVGLPIPDILANISQEGANRVFVDYLQRTTPESQYLVGDAHDADCAIVACSGAWLERCGYGEDEVIGRGCRHLQGPETCARAVAAMGEAMGRDGQCATSLINYHADGATPVSVDAFNPHRSASAQARSSRMISSSCPSRVGTAPRRATTCPCTRPSPRSTGPSRRPCPRGRPRRACGRSPTRCPPRRTPGRACPCSPRPTAGTRRRAVSPTPIPRKSCCPRYYCGPLASSTAWICRVWTTPRSSDPHGLSTCHRLDNCYGARTVGKPS